MQQRVARRRAGGPRPRAAAPLERGVRARVRQHRALAARLHEHDARPGRQRRVDREPRVDALRAQPLGGRRPAGSSPTRPISVTCAPARASQTATFAPAPPPRWTIRAAVSLAVGDRPVERRDDVAHDVAGDDDAPLIAAAARRSARPSAALRRTSATFASSVAPPVSRWKRSSRNGVVAPPRTPCAAAAASALGEHAVVQLGVDLLVRRQRVGDDDRAPPSPSPAWIRMTAATSSGRVDAPRDREAGVGEVEAREAVGAVAEHARR